MSLLPRLVLGRIPPAIAGRLSLKWVVVTWTATGSVYLAREKEHKYIVALKVCVSWTYLLQIATPTPTLFAPNPQLPRVSLPPVRLCTKAMY